MTRPLLALFPLELVLFPGATLPLHIFEDRYRAMIADCLERNAPFGVVYQRKAGACDVGTSAEVVRTLREYPDGRSDILTLGHQRFRIDEWDSELAWQRGRVEWLRDEGSPPDELIDEAIALYKQLFNFHGSPRLPERESSPIPLAFQLAASQLFTLEDRQRILELDSEEDRLLEIKESLTHGSKLHRIVQGNGGLH
jgi:Lon protease-like protein